MSETPAPPAPAAPAPVGIDIQDAAWVRIPTRYSVEELRRQLQDVEVLMRLNPYYYFTRWQKTGKDTFHAEFENQSNQQQVSVDVAVEPGPGSGLTLRYGTGMKQRTIFSIESSEQGSMLFITDDYSGTTEEQRRQRENEVDRSLAAWGEALRVYLLRLQRYRRVPGWRGYIRKFWIPMKPSARRIVWLLWIITVVEFFFFCFVVLIWWVEHQK